jgi:sulfur carrier protein ThiS
VLRVRLRNPDREVELAGDRRVRDVLSELAINPDTVLVIRDRELLTREERVGADDRIEIRPVISGGSRSERGRASGSPPRTGGA